MKTLFKACSFLFTLLAIPSFAFSAGMEPLPFKIPDNISLKLKIERYIDGKWVLVSKEILLWDIKNQRARKDLLNIDPNTKVLSVDSSSYYDGIQIGNGFSIEYNEKLVSEFKGYHDAIKWMDIPQEIQSSGISTGGIDLSRNRVMAEMDGLFQIARRSNILLKHNKHVLKDENRIFIQDDKVPTIVYVFDSKTFALIEKRFYKTADDVKDVESKEAPYYVKVLKNKEIDKIIIPTHIECKYRIVLGDLSGREWTALDQILVDEESLKINKQLTSKDFANKIPVGVTVHDGRTGAAYEADGISDLEFMEPLEDALRAVVETAKDKSEGKKKGI